MGIPQGLSPEQKKEYWKQYVKEWRAKNRDKTLAAVNRWRKRNPEKVKELAKKYRDENPDKVRALRNAWYKANPEKAKEMNRSYRERNREKVRARNNRYQRANKDKVKEWAKKCYMKNPEKAKARSRLRREKIKALNQGLSRGLVTRLIVSQNGLCRSCQCDISISGYHLDHIIALANGGKHEDSNIQLLCPTCNLSKGGK